MEDKEVIEWAKEKYPQYLDNIDLLRSLYRRQMLNESVFYKKREYSFRRLKDIKEGMKARSKFVLVEIRKKGEKNKRWFSVIIGDVSGMIKAMIFLENGQNVNIEEGKEYMGLISNKGEKGYAVNDIEEIDEKISLAIDSIYEYLYELNDGRASREKFIVFVEKRGIKYNYAKEIFALKEDGDIIIGG